ncbi:molybdopterin-dependent oxidoreductase [Halosimplex litoreum]|uniref:Molybdopterin-dependent oxidoreductase n=1 Tax=Halosimplex litoreum TaxID=1198301 RepID=A0A7T3KVZ3_9EURY|nr:molybdopterin-dependent oxidoreductase [Halosimplex litoreum]QPV63508.1 molybdopterin-dependent oxidoreductase [Halosimplex litoreum]
MTGDTPLADRYPPGLPTAVVAVSAGVAGLLGSFAAAGFAPGFVVAPVESTLSRRMPGAVVAFAITALGDLGQQLNLATAGALVVALFAALVALSVAVGRRLDTRLAPLLCAPAAVWAATALLTGRPVLSVGAAVGVGLVVWVTDLSYSGELAAGRSTPSSDGRRRVLAALGAALGASVLGYAVGRDGPSTGDGSSATNAGSAGTGGSADGDRPRGDPEIYGSADVPTFDADDQLAAAADREFDLDGTEPLVSERFYNVSYSSISPTPDAAEWSLSVTGEVGQEVSADYADLAEREFQHRFVTLRCVGESLNGQKMDTAVWSGVPIAPLIEDAKPNSDCDCVMVRAADDYYEEFPLEALESGFLALGMNGEPLPRSHGAPVRLLVPGHWGEINVKWITEIEFLEREADGYWEQKGWHGTGPVETVAKLHATNRTDDGQLEVGGHAYAGTRGIERVEVSTDGGDTWTDAELTERLPGATGAVEEPPDHAADAWRQWRHVYDPPAGSHDVVVRATDGTGTVQSSEERDAYPSGATGWVSETVAPGSVG